MPGAGTESDMRVSVFVVGAAAGAITGAAAGVVGAIFDVPASGAAADALGTAADAAVGAAFGAGCAAGADDVGVKGEILVNSVGVSKDADRSSAEESEFGSHGPRIFCFFTKTPFSGGHVKYLCPPTQPSFFPGGLPSSMSSTPKNSPSTCIGPM